MASAGRILIMPKGNWDANTEYEMLDLVFAKNTSWLAKKNSVGIEPSVENAEYWFLLCESKNLDEVNQRLAAIENQLLSTVSLDDIDFSSYATKAELSGYATKTDVNSINSNITSLDSRLDAAEPKITNLTSDVNAAKTNISNLSTSVSTLQTKVNGIPTSANTEIVTYVGNGKSGSSNPCSVTFSKIVPKAIVCIGWKQSNSAFQSNMQSGGYRYNVSFILCDELTTSFVMGPGFLFCDNTNQPSRYAKKSSDGKTISWYIDGDSQSQAQINQSGYKYYILGIS
jgi:outer membrane murein-binding lipoprotein Lpp